MEQTECSETSAYKLQRRGITQKKAYKEQFVFTFVPCILIIIKVLFIHQLMRGTNVKIIEAQQASLCNSYKNTKLKLLKANSAIRFNKMCKTTTH